MPELLAALDAFMQEHRRCGDLDGGVDGEHVWIVCDCGGGIAHPIRPPRPVPPKDYDRAKEYDRFGIAAKQFKHPPERRVIW